MRERKGVMDARSDAFLVLPGGIGTLEELFEIWTSRVLGMHDKPAGDPRPVGPVRAAARPGEGMYEAGFTRPNVFDAISWTTTVEEAFAHLERPPQPVAQRRGARARPRG